jgi:hypothetical protein
MASLPPENGASGNATSRNVAPGIATPATVAPENATAGAGIVAPGDGTQGNVPENPTIKNATLGATSQHETPNGNASSATGDAVIVTAATVRTAIVSHEAQKTATENAVTEITAMLTVASEGSAAENHPTGNVESADNAPGAEQLQLSSEDQFARTRVFAQRSPESAARRILELEAKLAELEAGKTVDPQNLLLAPNTIKTAFALEDQARSGQVDQATVLPLEKDPAADCVPPEADLAAAPKLADVSGPAGLAAAADVADLSGPPDEARATAADIASVVGSVSVAAVVAASNEVDGNAGVADGAFAAAKDTVVVSAAGVIASGNPELSGGAETKAAEITKALMSNRTEAVISDPSSANAENEARAAGSGQCVNCSASGAPGAFAGDVAGNGVVGGVDTAAADLMDEDGGADSSNSNGTVTDQEDPDEFIARDNGIAMAKDLGTNPDNAREKCSGTPIDAEMTAAGATAVDGGNKSSVYKSGRDVHSILTAPTPGKAVDADDMLTDLPISEWRRHSSGPQCASEHPSLAPSVDVEYKAPLNKQSDLLPIATSAGCAKNIARQPLANYSSSDGVQEAPQSTGRSPKRVRRLPEYSSSSQDANPARNMNFTSSGVSEEKMVHLASKIDREINNGAAHSSDDEVEKFVPRGRKARTPSGSAGAQRRRSNLSKARNIGNLASTLARSMAAKVADMPLPTAFRLYVRAHVESYLDKEWHQSMIDRRFGRVARKFVDARAAVILMENVTMYARAQILVLSSWPPSLTSALHARSILSVLRDEIGLLQSPSNPNQSPMMEKSAENVNGDCALHTIALHGPTDYPPLDDVENSARRWPRPYGDVSATARGKFFDAQALKDRLREQRARNGQTLLPSTAVPDTKKATTSHPVDAAISVAAEVAGSAGQGGAIVEILENAPGSSSFIKDKDIGGNEGAKDDEDADAIVGFEVDETALQRFDLYHRMIHYRREVASRVRDRVITIMEKEEVDAEQLDFVTDLVMSEGGPNCVGELEAKYGLLSELRKYTNTLIMLSGSKEHLKTGPKMWMSYDVSQEGGPEYV